MQTNTMMTIRLFFLLLLFPLTFHAQKTLTGVWTGSMSNDSSTIRKDQSFEIALTQYKQKVFGYSRSTFIVNDTLYYILKRVKGTINGDVCEIEDDEIVSYNFRGKIDKGVKVTTTFRMNKQDSAWYLAGNWNTNKTKRYYAVTGKVDLKDEPDIAKSKILPHLEELNLAKDIPFYAEAKKAEADEERRKVAANAQKEPVIKSATLATTRTTSEKTQAADVNKPVAQTRKPSATPVKTEEPTSEPVAILNKAPEKKLPAEGFSPSKTESGNILPASNTNSSVAEKKQEESLVSKTPVQQPELSPANVAEQKRQQQTAVNTIPEKTKTEVSVKKQEPVALVAEPKKQEGPAALTVQEPKKPVTITVENKPAIANAAAALVKERKMAAPQEVLFKADSLQVSLYDNGEIDGDTVSVLLNGEIILAKQGLKATAIRKTIYTQPGDNEFTMVLYAENLGKYPPNTGLLVVYDGEERYQVRFSADLQQNATIIFRRKK